MKLRHSMPACRVTLHLTQHLSFSSLDCIFYAVISLSPTHTLSPVIPYSHTDLHQNEKTASVAQLIHI